MRLSSQFVKSAALAIGFSDCGIASASLLKRDEYPLDEWIQNGYHAEMHYMERNTAMRRDPRLLVEGAQTVISLLVAYKPDRLIEGNVRIAQYAYGEDYHERFKRMLYQLIERIKEQYPDFEGRPFVDTAPISDRHWAARAGLGWIGKNTLLLHPQFGTYCFIGEIVTTSNVDSYDHPLEEHPCADCRLCVEACPNHAIRPLGVTFVVDARRCTAYNTIENRSENLPPDLITRNYAFGCDICQAVCPLNRTVTPSYHLSDQHKAQLEALPDADESTFRRITRHSALNRIHYPQWQRNIRHTKSRNNPS